MYVAIAGNIGSGKSFLAEQLGNRLEWKLYTDQNTNPYIEDFYNDMQGWSMHMQIYFLGQRLELISQILSGGHNAIVDRTIYEDAEIFALNLKANGLLSPRDYSAYLKLYDFTARHLTPPDLLIYLRATTPTLLKQIAHRGRPYEASIEPKYLEQLNQLYENWIGEYKGRMLIVDVDKEDFVNSQTVRETLLEKIEALLK